MDEREEDMGDPASPASCYSAAAQPPEAPDGSSPSRVTPAVADHLIWSHKHRAWWRPQRCGYTTDLLQAGLYTKTEATKLCGPHSGSEARHAASAIAELEQMTLNATALSVLTRRSLEHFRSLVAQAGVTRRAETSEAGSGSEASSTRSRSDAPSLPSLP